MLLVMAVLPRLSLSGPCCPIGLETNKTPLVICCSEIDERSNRSLPSSSIDHESPIENREMAIHLMYQKGLISIVASAFPNDTINAV
jgi:hypothetical protein